MRNTICFLIIIATILSGCVPRVPDVDFTKSVIACVHVYDSKDDIIFYEENSSTFESGSTGVLQYTYIDIYGKRRMLNEFEIENFKCVPIHGRDELIKVITD